MEHACCFLQSRTRVRPLRVCLISLYSWLFAFRHTFSVIPKNEAVNIVPIVDIMNDLAAEQRGITGIISIRPKGRGTNPNRD